MTHGHLADDRLIDLCLGTGALAPADDRHLAGCADCEARRAVVVRLLDDISDAAGREADLAFPPDRLARQQARILQRLDADSRPGRVLAFPAVPPHDPPAGRPARRSPPWIAAVAAAAGLTIGLLAGHLADLSGVLRPGIASPADEAPAPSLADGSFAVRPAVLIDEADDELLGQIELAVGSSVPAVLTPLNMLTPGASDPGR